MTEQEIVQAARDLVTRTCAAQGIPEQVTDPAAIARIAAILALPNGER